MDYSKIRCEDIESCTLREAIVEYTPVRDKK